MVYYNEFDPFASGWLRELIRAGMIAPGIVDDRSILDVTASDIKEFSQVHFFAGIGTWSYALRNAGWDDSRPVWTASCPCQPFSIAGKNGGFNDDRHLWPEVFRLVSQCLPDALFGEQVASADGYSWLDLVQTDLESRNYSVGAVVTPAAGYGAPHARHRLYWVADANKQQRNGSGVIRKGGRVEPANSSRAGFWSDAEWVYCRDEKYRPVEPGTFPLVNGAASRVGRLRGYGNGIVAPQAEEFIKAFMEVSK